MSDALLAIFGGAFLAAFIVIPAGAAETSGGNRKEPLTWASWCREAAVSLWAINPVTALRDLMMGYDDIADSVVRLMAGVVVCAALLTSTVLVGWGFWRLVTM